MCFVDNEKAFDRVPTKVMEHEKRQGFPQIIVRVVIGSHHRAETEVRSGSELSEKFLGELIYI